MCFLVFILEKKERRKTNELNWAWKALLIIIGHSVWSVDISSIMFSSCHQRDNSQNLLAIFCNIAPISSWNISIENFHFKGAHWRFIHNQIYWINGISAIVFIPTLPQPNWAIMTWRISVLYNRHELEVRQEKCANTEHEWKWFCSSFWKHQN